jgi:triphosphoribosyl-dephospho-CoA synthase
MQLGSLTCAHENRTAHLATWAVGALLEEVEMTPKPALVDRRGSGAHSDLTLARMYRSASSLRSMFAAMAAVAGGRTPSQALREQLARIGREGERTMLVATGGCNAHRGAIWSIGLLVAGAAMCHERATSREIAAQASKLARFPDRHAPPNNSHGSQVCGRYRVQGARGEALDGFPHVVEVGLPALYDSRMKGISETHARLNALMAIMSRLDDTCLLHRGGIDALSAAKKGARAVLDAGGSSTSSGMRALLALDLELLSYWASPGGSADMLAATLFLDIYRQRMWETQVPNYRLLQRLS